MATITSNGTGGGLWSAGATWAGGILPADNDTVVIAAGDVVDMDLDLTGWATGINGITITSHATTPGELRCYTGAPGKYGFKLKANTVIQGTNLTTKGIFRAGTSKASPLPQNITYEIIFGGSGANEMSQINGAYLAVYQWCTEPTIKYVQLTSPAIVGDTVLNVDQDVTADATRPWEANDYVVIATAVKTGVRSVEIKQIASMTATTITLSAGLTYAMPTGSVIALRTRNIRWEVQANLQTTLKDFYTQSPTVHNTICHLWCEMTNIRYAGGTGNNTGWTYSTGTHGRPRAAFWGGAGYSEAEASEGGVRFGLEALQSLANQQPAAPWNPGLVVLGCGVAGSWAGTTGEIVLIASGGANMSFTGTIKILCQQVGLSPTSNTSSFGTFGPNSIIEWVVDALASFGGGNYAFGGTVRNCNTLGVAGNIILTSTARVGVGVTNNVQLENGRWILYGCRINHASPPTAYLGSQSRRYPINGYIVGYDYADSSDVPQYGQIRSWQQGGQIEADTTPASPPSFLTAAFCHKMSHLATSHSVLIDIPVVLEAGTPYQSQIALKLGSAAYSWNQVPRFRLLGSDGGPFSSDAVVYAEAVDANGDPVDGATTAWQTLYIDYTLPVTTNRPRGAKVNAVLRAEAWVSNVSGTPYWHWNYTQGAVVNANVQYVSGVEEALLQDADIPAIQSGLALESTSQSILSDVGDIPVNPLLDSDGRLDNLDTPVSTRATPTNVSDAQTAIIDEINAIPQVTAADIRAAIGMASANLDAQLDALPTDAEIKAAIESIDCAGLPLPAAIVRILCWCWAKKTGLLQGHGPMTVYALDGVTPIGQVTIDEDGNTELDSLDGLP